MTLASAGGGCRREEREAGKGRVDGRQGGASPSGDEPPDCTGILLDAHPTLRVRGADGNMLHTAKIGRVEASGPDLSNGTSSGRGTSRDLMRDTPRQVWR